MCFFLLLKAHHNQIVANKSLINTLDSLKTYTKIQLQKQRDIIGFNKAAMNYLKRSIETESAIPDNSSLLTSQPKKKARKENK